MTDPGGEVSAMQRQSNILRQIAEELWAALPAGYAQIRYKVKSLRAFNESQTHIQTGEGQWESIPGPAVGVLARELRDVMYTPGSGTWFSAEVAVSASGSIDADFNYDEEPIWDTDVSPASFKSDLEKYPRTESAMPLWLRERVAKA